MTSETVVRVTVAIEDMVEPSERITLQSVLVDPETMLSWFPSDILDSLGIKRREVWRFERRDGSVVERDTGYVRLEVLGIATVDVVVFAEESDAVKLGAHSLSGLSLRVDPSSKSLVPAGPIPAAAAA